MTIHVVFEDRCVCFLDETSEDCGARTSHQGDSRPFCPGNAPLPAHYTFCCLSSSSPTPHPLSPRRHLSVPRSLNWPARSRRPPPRRSPPAFILQKKPRRSRVGPAVLAVRQTEPQRRRDLFPAQILTGSPPLGVCEAKAGQGGG